MKKILCFGDSNTFGYNPIDGSRFDKNTRWCGILTQKLAHLGFEVIEAGGNNRKCFINDIKELHAPTLLPQYLNQKLDYVVLGLGINDVQKMYKPDNKEIEEGITNLINIVKKHQNNAEIVVLIPAILNNNVTKHHYFSNLFDEWSVEQSKQIPKIYTEVGIKEKVNCIDLNDITKTCDIDGLHHTTKQHQEIAEYMFEYFKTKN